MEGLHILQIDDKIIEAIQVDAKGGIKVLRDTEFSTAKMTAHRIAWRWRLMEKINEELI